MNEETKARRSDELLPTRLDIDMNYDNPDGKYPAAKLTEPQVAFLRRCSAGRPYTVWPGPDTRVANGLQRAGLVSIASDYATLTDAGRERLAEFYQYDHAAIEGRDQEVSE